MIACRTRTPTGGPCPRSGSAQTGGQRSASRGEKGTKWGGGELRWRRGDGMERGRTHTPHCGGCPLTSGGNTPAGRARPAPITLMPFVRVFKALDSAADDGAVCTRHCQGGEGGGCATPQQAGTAATSQQAARSGAGNAQPTTTPTDAAAVALLGAAAAARPGASLPELHETHMATRGKGRVRGCALSHAWQRHQCTKGGT
jgi:hypothetical protein